VFGFAALSHGTPSIVLLLSSLISLILKLFIRLFVGCSVLPDLCEQLEVDDRKRRKSVTSASTASGKPSQSNNFTALFNPVSTRST